MAAAADVSSHTSTPNKGKKKLTIIVAAILLLALAGGGAVVYVAKKNAAQAAAQEEGDGADEPKVVKGEHLAVPVYVPLDPFVVNLADHDSDRYAQIGVTLEVEDEKFSEQIKNYMPAIRNEILMILAHKNSHELLERSGKEALAAEIMRAAVRPMGIEIEPPAPQQKADPEHDAESNGVGAELSASPTKKSHAATHNPVRKVHFSSFIVQ